MVGVLLEVLLFLMLVAHAPVFNDAQREGFISLDCGSPAGTKYTDEVNGITYTSDADYIFTGEKRDISPTTELIGLPSFFRNARIFRSARIFPVGDRNCYTLKPVRKGDKYLVRVWFMYDNYDGVEQAPIFDLYLGVNLWLTIQLSGRGSGNFYEIITMAKNAFIDVCLVRKENLGHPYISALELKPLQANAYNAAAAQDLLCIGRDDIGYTPDYTTYRYKDDPYDRFWWPFNLSNAEVLEGASIDPNKDTNVYRPPQEVMSTAMEPTNDTAPLTRSWAMYKSWNIYPRMFIYAHVGEVDSALRPAGGQLIREFRACIQDTNICFGTFRTNRTNNSSTLTISSEAIPVDPRKDQYVLTLHRTDQSDLPPILNAFEMYLGQDRSVIPTYEDDLNAVVGVRDFHGIKKNWMGDPCLPAKYSWEGITCNYNTADIALGPRITHLNLSASGLNGSISPSIGNLSSLESLDLSDNSLSGEVPDCLGDLSSLTSLNLSGNYFTGSVPPVLLRKSNDGSLELSMEGNPELCKSNSCNSSKPKLLIIFILVSVAAVVIILGMTFCFWRKLKRGKLKLKMKGIRPGFEKSRITATSSSSFNLDNRRFTYPELVDITDNFSRLLGRGGFATVYHGILKDGNQVAVKMISRNCSGSSEFQTEAQLLTRVHHKNLVRFIGYCADGTNQALVLEYMPKGNLDKVLLDMNDNSVVLTWSQRLRIALDIALGLEYLHVGCKPPIIHRDVKLTNILLNDKLEAKIADFGISKVFHDHDELSHASTTGIKGTFGYLDPEYYIFHNLNEKSDVYGFGIILLVLVTGKPAIIQFSDGERISIVEWVRNYTSHGDLQSILDPRLGGDWDSNSAWMAIEVAIESSRDRCIERPSMSDVVIQLKECLGGVDQKASSRAGSFGHTYYSGTSIYTDSMSLPKSR